MGFADSPTTKTVLAGYGVRVSGYVWRWAPGLKGGTFPPHYDQNGNHAPTADSFDAYPGEDVNGDSCTCNLPPVYRNSDGTFARPDNLVPIFQPPVTAAMEVHRPEPIDWQPLVAALADRVPVNIELRVPDSAIVVNLPPFDFRLPAQPAPVVNVDARLPAPIVNVSAPEVTVNVPKQDPPVVNVDVKPAPVKVIREKIVGKSVRFFRGNDGKIDTAEVTE